MSLDLETLIDNASIPKGATPWPVSLPFEIALILEQSGDPLPNVLDRMNLTPNDFRRFSKMNAFQYAVSLYQAQLKDKTVIFKLRAQVMAEEWLVHDANSIMRDPEATSASKVELFKHVTNIAGYIPKQTSTQQSSTEEGGFSLKIVFENTPDRGSSYSPKDIESASPHGLRTENTPDIKAIEGEVVSDDA